MPSREYVRLTFKPAGASRRVMCWAVVVKRTATRVTYLKCDNEGETVQDGGTQDGLPVERTHMIVATPAEVTERPARMNLKYALLEVVP
jgi:hypothetical protein